MTAAKPRRRRGACSDDDDDGSRSGRAGVRALRARAPALDLREHGRDQPLRERRAPADHAAAARHAWRRRRGGDRVAGRHRAQLPAGQRRPRAARRDRRPLPRRDARQRAGHGRRDPGQLHRLPDGDPARRRRRGHAAQLPAVLGPRPEPRPADEHLRPQAGARLGARPRGARAGGEQADEARHRREPQQPHRAHHAARRAPRRRRSRRRGRRLAAGRRGLHRRRARHRRDHALVLRRVRQGAGRQQPLEGLRAARPAHRLDRRAAPTSIADMWAWQDYVTICTTVLANKLAAIALSPDVRPQILARTRELRATRLRERRSAGRPAATTSRSWPPTRPRSAS